MKVGFLFLHEAPHQVAHSLPIALTLSMLRPDFEVGLICRSGDGEAAVVALAASAPHRCRLVALPVRSRAVRWAERLAGNSLPLGRVALLRENLDLFRGLDALVVPEKTSLLLKTRFRLGELRMIHSRHGAGDRAIGFNRESGLFDFQLLPGRKVRDRLAGAGLLRSHAIVGYPKFDLVPPRDQWPRLFDNERPTVLYNPHPTPHLSSWYRMGRQILDWFARSADYNLVFAPHVMLFRRRLHIGLDPLSVAATGRVPAALRAQPHMIVDTGSARSVDMTYTLGADIYLGDASSQVYEFLIEPRPALFANPRRIGWEGDSNFAHWQAGPVFTRIEELPEALARARAEHGAYAPIQKPLFDDSFDLRAQPSSERAAQAVADYLTGRA